MHAVLKIQFALGDLEVAHMLCDTTPFDDSAMFFLMYTQLFFSMFVVWL